LHKQHLIHTLQSLQYVKALTHPSVDRLNKKGVHLPKYLHPSIKKVAVFDLDETLIHCVDDPTKQSTDIVLEVVFPNGDRAEAGINVRPYALECLREAKKYFQIVVFTASH
jgi:CTD small phosphatase-like protein 2